MKSIQKVIVSIDFGSQELQVGELIKEGRGIYFKYYTEFIKTGFELSDFVSPPELSDDELDDDDSPEEDEDWEEEEDEDEVEEDEEDIEVPDVDAAAEEEALELAADAADEAA